MNKFASPPPFFDEEERDFIESFEAALENGEVRKSTPAELERLKGEWKAIAANSVRRKAVTLRLQERDIDRLKSIALQKGLPYQTLVASVLHQYAAGDLKEVAR